MPCKHFGELCCLINKGERTPGQQPSLCVCVCSTVFTRVQRKGTRLSISVTFAIDKSGTTQLHARRRKQGGSFVTWLDRTVNEQTCPQHPQGALNSLLVTERMRFHKDGSNPSHGGLATVPAVFPGCPMCEDADLTHRHPVTQSLPLASL